MRLPVPDLRIIDDGTMSTLCFTPVTTTTRTCEPLRASSTDARLGRAIRGLRRDRGLTLVQVAAASGLSQPFLSQLELGRTRPSMRSLFRIAQALGTTQQTLLALAEEPVVPFDAGGGGRARLLMHAPGTDVTEFVGLCGEFSEFFRHDRHELLYVVRGTLEVELLEHGVGSRAVLRARESMGYAGTVEHRFRQVGPEECVVLVIHSAV
jgi:transcriptional regulator with XRE-family HTH domain